MVEDPYRVLGIPSTATKDEIKRAYRKKAKEYHPDLHPNDPNAARKMNEVNEAYDMLINPEKYKGRRENSKGTQHSGQYSGTGQAGGGGYRNMNGNAGNNTGSTRGSGGWSSDFGGFSFEDLFGFGSGGGYDEGALRPEAEATDSAEIRRAVFEIQGGRHQTAIDVLTYIRSNYRDARWHYLSSVANHGIGNTVTALDHIQKAIRLDPNNTRYQSAYKILRRSEETYERNSQGFNTEAVARMQKICFGFLAIQCLCSPVGPLRCLGGI